MTHLSRFISSLIVPVALALVLGISSTISAHGFAGQRFFPATLATDDPFVADELSLPTLSTIRTPGDGGTREFDVSFSLAKRITPHWDIEVGVNLITLFPHGDSARAGFDNLGVASKYQLITNDAHEFIFSFGVDIDVGGTGAKRVGREAFTAWTPGVFFGKGFGDLPVSLPWLRPFALTGQVGVAIPSSTSSRTETFDPVMGTKGIDVERHAVSLEYGFALEYSFIYLQEHVRDMGLRAPFNRLIPLVEFVVSTPLNRGQAGQTTGTIQPGVIWSGRFCQVGVEAVIPLNSRTGNNVGVIGQLHFYLDDLFPRSLGKPLFGK